MLNIVLISLNLWGQNCVGGDIIIGSSSPCAYNHWIVRDKLRLEAGFSFSSTGTNYFRGEADENIMFSVENQKDEFLTETQYNTFDQSLPVGTVKGHFNVSPSGGATYSVPIRVAPGTNNLQPSLSVSYNSQGGPGLLGYGWNLGGISAITRGSTTFEQDGAIIGAENRFLLDGNKLIVIGTGTYGANGTTYGTEKETFVEVESFETNSALAGPEYFIVKTKDGQIIEYGKSNSSLITDNANNIVWKVNKITDHLGNYMTFHYEFIDGEQLLKVIKYTGNDFEPYNRIDFYYHNDRPDSNKLYSFGGRIIQKHVLRKIKVTSFDLHVRSYEFKYAVSDLYVHLNEIIELGKNYGQYNSTKFKYDYLANNYPNNINVIQASTTSSNEDEKYIGDFNGDGLQDFIKTDGGSIVMYVSNGDFTFTSITPGSEIPSNNNGIFVHDYNSDGIDEFYLKKTTDNKAKLFKLSTNSIVSANQPEIQLSSIEKILSFDIDGDGKGDKVVINNQGFVQRIIGWDVDLPDIICPDKKNFGSFNGNSKIDFFYEDTDFFELYEYNGINGFTKIADYEFLHDIDFEVFGDFNGDGKRDLIHESENKIYLYYFDGKNFICKPDFQLADYDETIVGNGLEGLKSADLNGDGKSDLIKTFTTDVENVYVYYSYGDGFAPPIKYTDFGVSLNKIDWLDINGDGNLEFYTKNTLGYESIISFKPEEYNLNLSHIKNGLGYETEISYNSIASVGSNYQKGSYSDIYPIMIFRKPLNVVSTVKVPDGVGGTSDISYQYEGARLHLKGNGFLGFHKTIVSNSSSGEQKTVTNSWVPNSHILSGVTNELKLNAVDISVETMTFGRSIISSESGKKRYFDYVSEISNENKLTGAITNKVFGYYSAGIWVNWLEDETITFTGGTDEEVITSYTYADLSTTEYNFRVVSNIQITRTIDNDTHLNEITFSEPNSDKLWTVKTVNNFSTDLTFDSYGNLTKEEFTIDGALRRTEYNYDSFGRFLVEKKTNSQINGNYKESFTYDPTTGNVLSSTHINGLSSYYKYDEFGRMIHSESPEGEIVIRSLSWVKNEGVCYTKTETSNNGPTTIIHYDLLGREVEMVSETFNGDALYTSKTYNPNGSIGSESLPHISSESRDVVYQYRTDGRLDNKTMNSNLTTSYSYSGLTITVTGPDGNYKTKTFDAAGRLRAASENGGTPITYKYDGCGKPDEITYGLYKTIALTYDANGYQETLYDPDVGSTIQYDYNPIGELISMTDGKGETTTYTYDAYGRLEFEDTPEGRITSVYNNSGFGIGQLATKSFGGVSQAYTYDYYGRLKTATENILSESAYQKTFDYDQFGNLISEKLDANADGTIEMNINREYLKGSMHKIQSNGTILWQVNSVNSDGNSLNYTIGNETVTKTYDDYGFLTNIYYGDYFLNYIFNEETGNLEERYNSMSGLRETFSYDNLNRLTDIYYEGSLFHSTNYNEWGNITSRTNAGYYDYDEVSKGAVSQISTEKEGDANQPGTKVITPPPIPTNISTIPQGVSYNSSGNPINISQSYHTYQFNYGPNKKRKKQIYSRNVSPYNSIYTYYHGDYEFEADMMDGEKQTFYISSPDGICAMYIIENGSPTLYHVHTDHQGSIIGLRNSTTGILDEVYSYDAWGRRRNPYDYSYSVLSTNLTNRGYTGHEHLDLVQLINMNGRMYDPIVGRMLSPDNNIQAPDFSQNLNRYSYCLNNPLKYIDPTGEFFITGTALIMAAILGGSINLISQGIQGNIDDGLDALKAFGIGAGVGALSAFGGAAALAGVTQAGIAASSFIGGTLSGAASGFIGGFGSGTLNSKILGGMNWDDSFSKGWNDGVAGTIAGGAIGGIIGGASALKDGRRFFTGTHKCNYNINLNKGNPYLIKTRWGKESFSDQKWIDIKDFDNMETNINHPLQDGTYKITWDANEGAGVRTIVSNDRTSSVVGGTARWDKNILKGGWKVVSGSNINVRTEMINGTNYNLSIDKLVQFTNYRRVIRGFYFAW